MDLPPLTRRGFWIRIVVSSINLLIFICLAVLVARTHKVGPAVLIGVFGVLGLFPLGSLVATFWNRPRHPS